MAVNEQIVTGRKFRKLLDEATKLWQRISFWTKATDVEFDDGQTAESKMGAIKGITTDLNVTETGYAADATMLTQLYSEITGLNLKDQELQNALAALDTRVTNAINGGDLAPKVTIDLLNAPYTDSTDSSYAVQSAQKSLSVVCDVKNCTTQRVWNYPIKITKGMKLIYNVSGAQYGQGSSVKSSGIRIGSNVIGFGSGTIDLAPYLNQTLTFSAFLVGYAGSTVINFNKMTVTNA